MANFNGHAYVQIGNYYWATMNIGASSITDYGQYFQWGDTTGYAETRVGTGSNFKPFNFTDYIFGNGDSSLGLDVTTVTKYHLVDLKTSLDMSDDGARANWGGTWRVPTLTEFNDLTANTNVSWVTNYNSSGTHGMLLTSKTDSSKKLFFPAFGYCSGDGGVLYLKERCFYWTKELLNKTSGNPDDAIRASNLCHTGASGTLNMSDSSKRYRGMPIRAVTS